MAAGPTLDPLPLTRNLLLATDPMLGNAYTLCGGDGTWLGLEYASEVSDMRSRSLSDFKQEAHHRVLSEIVGAGPEWHRSSWGG